MYKEDLAYAIKPSQELLEAYTVYYGFLEVMD